MNYRKYVELIAGIVFLVIAAYFISTAKPAIYVPASVFGFMFLFQGIGKLRRK